MKLLTLISWAIALSAFATVVVLPAKALPSASAAGSMNVFNGERATEARGKMALRSDSRIEAKTISSQSKIDTTQELAKRSGLLDKAMGAHGLDSTSRRSMALQAALTGNSGDLVLCKCCIDHNSNYCCGGGHCCNNACANLELEDRTLGQAAAGELPSVAAARTIAQTEAKAEHVERKSDDVEALERHTFKPYQASTSGVKREPIPGTTPRGHGIDATSRRSFPGEKDITLRGQGDIKAAIRNEHEDICACCHNHGYLYCCEYRL